MRIIAIFLFFIFYSLDSFSQNDKDVLFTIDKKPFFVSEFKRVYEDNLNLLDDEKQKDVQNNFDLFVNFKLKIKEAYALQLDTTRTYKREINSFRNQLMTPYLQDSAFQSKLIKDAYYRTKYKIKASHILITIPENSSPKDTLEAYQKIIKARNEILSGKPFEQVAKQYSDDKSVADNGGDLGYFTAFKMVHAFEDAAYATKIGEVSMPFKTNFGYHIIKVFDLKESGGEIEVAHILIADTSAKGKSKIDSVYNKLKNGTDFESLVKQYSNDNGTSKNGGKLPKFGVGMMMPAFENVAFSLKDEHEFSKPFLTNYGWHIIKLLKKYPIKPFHELKDELATRLKSIGGARLSNEALIKKLKKKYTIEINEKAKSIFNSPEIREYSNDSLKSFIIKINQKEISQIDFKNYLHNRRHKPVGVLFELFLEENIISYFKENLVKTEPEYAAKLKMYEEGLLMFELMNIEVWDKSVKDTLGLQQYFDTNRNKYTFKELSKNKGEVVNDYQTYLETQLLLNLRKKYDVKINNKIVKKLIDFYRKND